MFATQLPKNVIRRCCSANAFEADVRNNFCATSSFQRSVLIAGSALVSILNPYRGDMIACFAELSGERVLRDLRAKMERSSEGARILDDQPRINTRTVLLDHLSGLPEDTLGKTYFDFLNKYRVTPDERVMVQFIEDPGLAYVMQRYREIHDLIHTVLLMPTNMLGEVTVKWVEALQFKLPMCVTGAIFGPIRLKPKHRNLYLTQYLPWAVRTGNNAEFLLNCYFEKRWEQKLSDFHREFNIQPLAI
ncbi:ubiquinone biosynthesis protein COQ4 homolog, mitochondrial [Cylas formicarius]|uniref:ubiquinone biosynthesis protein COQ4 homolog, mitochondrial n=1 Tax=Cylas formicarius TaxID=197179 RepID=UPI0029586B3E|nr:ubiquinone biosynthesis protein COQ4 homolog, mitochondrial [Cylas formicarius]